jgi:hypothetical protein
MGPEDFRAQCFSSKSSMRRVSSSAMRRSAALIRFPFRSSSSSIAMCRSFSASLRMTAGKLLLSREAYSDRTAVALTVSNLPGYIRSASRRGGCKASIQIVDLSDQAMLFAFDIEPRPLACGVRARKSFRISPRSLQVALLRCETTRPAVLRDRRAGWRSQLLAADDVHAAPRVRILRRLYFAKCEVLNLPAHDSTSQRNAKRRRCL